MSYANAIGPIHTEAAYEKALEEVYKLMDAKADTPEGNRLEVLSILVEHYENLHFPIGLPDPIEAIKYRMEEKGMNITALGKIIGYKTRASEILNRKRKLTLGMIRKISAALNIPLDVLVQAY